MGTVDMSRLPRGFFLGFCTVVAMQGRGRMHLDEIYRATRSACGRLGFTIPPGFKFEEGVRRTLQNCCRSSKDWQRRDDWFVSYGGGWWLCKVTVIDDAMLGIDYQPPAPPPAPPSASP